MRKTFGSLLMASSLLVGLVAAPAATAAEDGEVPEDREEATLERTAYWNADYSKYAENTATKQFPPEAVCLVQPQACFFPEGDSDPSSDLPTGSVTSSSPTEDCQSDSGGLGTVGNTTLCEMSTAQREALLRLREADQGFPPADPLPEDTLPVSVAFGKPNYRSAIDVQLPTLPEGEEVDSFVLVLEQTEPTYSNESPALRQAVLAALTCASENEESPIGRCTQEEFEKIARNCDGEEGGTPCLTDDTPLLVEACPIVGEWDAGESKDEDTLPEVDCVFSTVGTPVTDGDTTFWVFDLTFTAQAWYDGLMENKGLLLRPGAAENFAYGDPETTFSKQVTFLEAASVAVETSEPPPPPAPLPPLAPAGGGSDFGDTSGSGGFAPPPSTGSGEFGPPPQSGGSASMTEQPAVSEQQPAPTEQPQTAAPETEETQTLAAGSPLGDPQNPWWLWLLLVPFLGGAVLLSRAFTEEAVVATQRSGAMTRLLERQQAARAGDLVTG